MDLQTDGKVALVTGASIGIGRAMAVILHRMLVDGAAYRPTPATA